MEPVQQRADCLYAILERRAPARAKAWLTRAGLGPGQAIGGAAFANELAAAARWLGKDAVVLGDEERRELEGVGVSLPPGLSLDELGRIAMLVALSARAPQVTIGAGPQNPRDGCEAVHECVDDCYRRGETRERRAVLRALPLLRSAERFIPLAADACRTNVLPVFEAVACENPYPATHFPDASFHQMVLKALFLGVALDRVVGLAARTTPELVRMAEGYASERRAAGRSVPADIERHFGVGDNPARRSS